MREHEQTPQCCQPRRAFLADVGMGFAGLALGSLLGRDGHVRAAEGEAWIPPDGKPHFAPRAKAVIWLFFSGGYSHLETFDPKPALTKYDGKTFSETPYPDPLASPLHDRRSRSVVPMKRDVFPVIYPMQVGFQKYGQAGVEITDWWPHLARRADDIAFVRNMWTTDNDHAAENQMHTGRHKLDEIQPSLGAWVQYGLGSLNDNLPEYAVLGGPTRADNRVSIGSYYLGPKYSGVPLALDPKNPLPYGKRPADVSAREQANEFELINQLNQLSAVEYPQDETLRARIRTYELAFRMQTAVPEALDLATETADTQQRYGLDKPATKMAGERCLAARRLVERGVRFVQVYPSGYGVWDSHTKLKENHTKLCAEVDQPVAALLADLKQRGLWDDVVVVFCTEFGRTPGVQTTFTNGAKDGRDHHPHGFTVWFAGAGIKGGTVHGATDELGFHAIEPAHYVTDIHATVLHLLGLDGRRLEIPGRKRLDIDHGKPIAEILA
ncbi:MAG: DUF1501 domain-containing protein [Planctomycetia bacterium]|nr:DUF1501 domain-containing protein [Planctomycetia bacterium]